MQKQLAKGEACFDFMVQLRTHPSEMPIEDPTIAWNEVIAPFNRVARSAYHHPQTAVYLS
ncbi:hypothetical protein [Methylomonas sp. AM2-LC]|uniref:hypothetical protein n=1 Tax=Methylomonas sp. AM2-LC TaxID=3153301 RepID=UPI0032646D68